jgi:hypothetical protein
MYFQYLKYLLRHKYFVFKECTKRGFIWRGLIHDFSKFLPNEFISYAKYFYGKYPSYIQSNVETQMNYAWLKHQKLNKHHWQYWVLMNDDGTIQPLEIPYKYLVEMLCDWIAVGKNFGSNPKVWYYENKEHIVMHENSRQLLELLLK